MAVEPPTAVAIWIVTSPVMLTALSPVERPTETLMVVGTPSAAAKITPSEGSTEIPRFLQEPGNCTVEEVALSYATGASVAATQLRMDKPAHLRT